MYSNVNCFEKKEEETSSNKGQVSFSIENSKTDITVGLFSYPRLNKTQPNFLLQNTNIDKCIDDVNYKGERNLCTIV